MTRSVPAILIAICLVLAGLALAQAPSAKPKVLLSTTMGDITIELYPAKAPVTVQNFLEYVKAKFYDGLIFHRVTTLASPIVQAGALTAEMHTRSGRPPIKNESGNGLKNVRGSVAMARGEAPDSATSQFYINVGDNLPLDGLKYCVFGKVVAGLDVVEAISKVPTGKKRGYADVPLDPVTILSATVVR